MASNQKWPAQPVVIKIDTHHHFVPDFYAKAIEDAGGDPSGWKTPSWSPELAAQIMEHSGVQTAILSVTAPGACILKDSSVNELARNLNYYGASLRDKEPKKFGFFASLPNILDTQAALAEIEYAFDTLHADGVTLFTRYGEGNAYLGHPSIEPIWAELNRRKAVVFVHPTHSVDTTPVNNIMPQPLIDYPHETTRTAFDMITMGTRRKYSDCKVILSHAGGNLPWIISRAADMVKYASDDQAVSLLGMTHEQAMDDLRTFYYDLALSTNKRVLDLLFDTVPHDHILYGSDFPYAPSVAYPSFLEQLEQNEMTQDLRDKINFKNALALFPRLSNSDSDA